MSDIATMEPTRHRGLFVVHTTSARGFRSAVGNVDVMVAFADPELEARLGQGSAPPPFTEDIRAAAEAAGVTPMSVMLAAIPTMEAAFPSTFDLPEGLISDEDLAAAIDTPVVLVGSPDKTSAAIAAAEDAVARVSRKRLR